MSYAWKKTEVAVEKKRVYVQFAATGVFMRQTITTTTYTVELPAGEALPAEPDGMVESASCDLTGDVTSYDATGDFKKVTHAWTVYSAWETVSLTTTTAP